MREENFRMVRGCIPGYAIGTFGADFLDGRWVISTKKGDRVAAYPGMQ
jgi:hypothetical protein